MLTFCWAGLEGAGECAELGGRIGNIYLESAGGLGLPASRLQIRRTQGEAVLQQNQGIRRQASIVEPLATVWRTQFNYGCKPAA